MEALVAIVVLAALLAVPLWAILRILALGRENDALRQRQLEIEAQFDELRFELQRHAPSTSATAVDTPPAGAEPTTEPTEPVPQAAAAEAKSVSAPPNVAAPAETAVPPVPTPPPPRAEPPPLPPPLAVPSPRPASPEPARATRRINWEEFMGARLFGWLGALAAFLGTAFLIRYSFEHDLISPALRVAAGFAFGIALVAGGLKVPRERYAVTAQSLIATGIVSLYAVTFASNSIYHFFGPILSFALMSAITACAFALAVRLSARVIAVLGIAGGFLTPALLSTGQDNAAALFGYIALLDLGLLAIALRRRWMFLAPLGTVGTVLVELGWAGSFLNASKAPVAMVVTLGFSAVFLTAHLVAQRTRQPSREISGSALALAIVALAFAAVFLGFPTVAGRPVLWFGFVLLADACLLCIAWTDKDASHVHLVAGLLVFGLLAGWTLTALTTERLWWGLAMYLVFAVLHTGFPAFLERRRPAASPSWWSQIFPALSLVLILVPVLKLETLSLGIWPVVLLVDVVAFIAAAVVASAAGVVVVLVLTLITVGVWMFRAPMTETLPLAMLAILSGFALVFFAANAWLSRRTVPSEAECTRESLRERRAQLPALSALLPFALLIMVAQRLPGANPTPLFLVALLLVVLTFGLSAALLLEWLPGCALMGTVLLELAWQGTHPVAAAPSAQLFWQMLFGAVFAAYPFVFRRRFQGITGPWALAALGWGAQFPFAYRLVQHAWPDTPLAIVPALAAVVPLASFIAVVRQRSDLPTRRLDRLAWFGGATLLFVTLILPIQFERQWLTLGWALEGVALVWLFRRVPHPGLRAVGVTLLVIAFARLALNPAVLGYHVRGDTAVLNWYLYAYGVVTVALFAAARLLAPPRHLVLGLRAPVLLNTLGTILAFVLLNIEIADFFSAPGTGVLTFHFSGNFARDMAYTIGWSLFALVLLLISLQRGLRAGRYAGLSLLGVAVLKLFLHDLARLESLYRIGALFGVAIVAILASLAYQRFLTRDRGQ